MPHHLDRYRHAIHIRGNRELWAGTDDVDLDPPAAVAASNPDASDDGIVCHPSRDIGLGLARLIQRRTHVVHQSALMPRRSKTSLSGLA